MVKLKDIIEVSKGTFVYDIVLFFAKDKLTGEEIPFVDKMGEEYDLSACGERNWTNRFYFRGNKYIYFVFDYSYFGKFTRFFHLFEYVDGKLVIRYYAVVKLTHDRSKYHISKCTGKLPEELKEGLSYYLS